MAEMGASHWAEAMAAIQVALQLEPDEKSYLKQYRDLKKKAPNADDEHGARVAAVKEATDRAVTGGIKTQEDYDALVGNKPVGLVPAAAKDKVLSFANSVLTDMKMMIEKNMDMQHRVFFHRPTDTDQSPANMVGIEQVFESLATIRECNGFLGNHAINVGADAAVIVMSKKDMQFWCPWRVMGKDKWPYKNDEEGFFFEIASKDFREMRFVPVMHKRGKTSCGEEFVLLLDEFSPFAPLFN
mgnify:CR=1 FL=1